METGNQPKNFFKIGMPTYSGTPLFLQKTSPLSLNCKKYVIPIRNKYLFTSYRTRRSRHFISMGKRLFSMGSWMYISSILKIHSSWIYSKQLLRYLSDPTTTNDDYLKKNDRNNRNGRFVRDRPTSRKRSGRYSYSAGSSKERFRQWSFATNVFIRFRFFASAPTLCPHPSRK